MPPQRTAILLAPVSLATSPLQSGFPKARNWQEREHAMRPLLGEAFCFPIESAALTDVGIAKLLPSGIRIAREGHDCTVFKSGVAIIQLRLTFDDARPLLQQWPGDGEKQLLVQMYKLGNKILPGSLDPTRNDVDWTYYIVDTDSYID